MEINENRESQQEYFGLNKVNSIYVDPATKGTRDYSTWRCPDCGRRHLVGFSNYCDCKRRYEITC